MKRMVVFWVGLAGLLLLMMCIWSWDRKPVVATPMPNPNAYETFVSASQILSPGDPGTMSQEELRTFVAGNSNALQQVRQAFSQDCRVPLEFSDTDLTNHISQLPRMKQLAQAFAAEGRLAENEGRTADAARSYLDTVHLGVEMTRGGLLIDGLVAIAVQAIGMGRLQAIIGQLETQSCRDLLTTLESLEGRRPSCEEIQRGEQEWSRRAYPGIRYRLAKLMTAKSLQQTQQGFKRKYDEQHARMDQMRIDLASRAYELENGSRPSDVSALVPKYLKAIPPEPTTGTSTMTR